MMEKQRVYFVIDMKSFYASVECAERGLDPMTTNLVVADASRTEKTICLAVSPSLKSQGVSNRCRLFEIPKSIDYIIAPPRMKKYIQYASEIYAIYLKYIDKSDIHVYSIDESFIDVTDYLKLYKMRAKDFAKKLMGEIYDKLKIPSTTGIGTNLYLAKIALDITAKHAKDRIGWLNEEKFMKELWNHSPLTDFWGISRGISTRLAKMGINTMKDITMADEEAIYAEFGVNAELLIDHAYGRESCLMSDIKNYKRKSHSISMSQILPCPYSFDDGKIVMQEMIQEGCYRLAREEVVSQSLGIYIVYQDKTATKGNVRMMYTTNLYTKIIPYVKELYEKIVDKKKQVRKIGFEFSDLHDYSYEQYDLFTDRNKVEKDKRFVESVLNIKDKFGKNSILKGIDFEKNATQKERNIQIGGHRSGESEDEQNR